MVPVMASEVVLIRHGATEWTASGQHTGRTDIPLTDEGRAQAVAVRDRIAARTYSLVLVSPLQRARETCRIVGLDDVAEVDEDLEEWDYGDYEGLTTEQIRASRPGWTVFGDGVMPGGEDIGEVGARADRVIARADAVEGPVALVAHGHILRILGARWIGDAPLEAANLALDTATLCVLGYEHERKVIRSWNC
jgi:probable phosphoglycerate mutase